MIKLRKISFAKTYIAQKYLICAALCFSLSTAGQAIGESATNPGDDLTPRFEKDSLYIEECGTCHLAYPPMLLPAKIWKNLVDGLDNHFGDDATIERSTLDHIDKYLQTHALETETQSKVGHWLKTIAEQPPNRITELTGFVEDHADAYRRMGESSRKTGFFSPCADCHKEAGDGIFDKERLFRGVRHIFNRYSGGK